MQIFNNTTSQLSAIKETFHLSFQNIQTWPSFYLHEKTLSFPKNQMLLETKKEISLIFLSNEKHKAMLIKILMANYEIYEKKWLENKSKGN